MKVQHSFRRIRASHLPWLRESARAHFQRHKSFGGVMFSSMNKSAIERAFEIARSGAAANVDNIKRKLSREGYNQDQIYGRTLIHQLNDVMREVGTFSGVGRKSGGVGRARDISSVE